VLTEGAPRHPAMKSEFCSWIPVPNFVVMLGRKRMLHLLEKNWMLLWSAAIVLVVRWHWVLTEGSQCNIRGLLRRMVSADFPADASENEFDIGVKT
jgi:hypothetical protein